MAKGQGYLDDAMERTGHALGAVASQTRAAGDRAAKLIGVELPKKTQAAAGGQRASNKTTARKQPATKSSRTLTAT